MAKTCQVCASQDRDKVNQRLVTDEAACAVAREFKLAEQAGMGHQREHLVLDLARCQDQLDLGSADSLAATFNSLLAKLTDLQGKLEGQKDWRGALVATREIASMIELGLSVTKATTALTPPEPVCITVVEHREELERELRRLVETGTPREEPRGQIADAWFNKTYPRFMVEGSLGRGWPWNE